MAIRRREEVYFQFLCRKLGLSERPGENYFKLCRTLFFFPFEDTLEDEDNIKMNAIQDRYGDLEGPCNMLELVVHLVEMMASEVDRERYDLPFLYWFKELLNNLGLLGMNDDVYDWACQDRVEWVLEDINSRSYEDDGKGGFFPLKAPPGDVRKIKICYQLNQYMYENYY